MATGLVSFSINSSASSSCSQEQNLASLRQKELSRRLVPVAAASAYAEFCSFIEVQQLVYALENLHQLRQLLVAHINTPGVSNSEKLAAGNELSALHRSIAATQVSLNGYTANKANAQCYTRLPAPGQILSLASRLVSRAEASSRVVAIRPTIRRRFTFTAPVRRSFREILTSLRACSSQWHTQVKTLEQVSRPYGDVDYTCLNDHKARLHRLSLQHSLHITMLRELAKLLGLIARHAPWPQTLLDSALGQQLNGTEDK